MAALSGDLGRTTPGTTRTSSAGPPGGILHAGNALTQGQKPPLSHSHSHPLRPNDGGQLSTQGPRCRLDSAQTPQQGWPTASAPGMPRALSTLTLGLAPRWLWAVVSAGSSHLPQQTLLPRGVQAPLPSSPVSPADCSHTHLGLLDLELTPRPSCESPALHPGLIDTPPPGPPEQGRSGSSLPAPKALSVCR